MTVTPAAPGQGRSPCHWWACQQQRGPPGSELSCQLRGSGRWEPGGVLAGEPLGSGTPGLSIGFASRPALPLLPILDFSPWPLSAVPSLSLSVFAAYLFPRWAHVGCPCSQELGCVVGGPAIPRVSCCPCSVPSLPGQGCLRRDAPAGLCPRTGLCRGPSRVRCCPRAGTGTAELGTSRREQEERGQGQREAGVC